MLPIFTGIAAAGSLAGAGAALGATINTKKFQNAQLERQKAHHAEVERLLKGKGVYLPEYQKGDGFSEGIKAFAKKSSLSDAASKILRTALKPLSDKLKGALKAKNK